MYDLIHQWLDPKGDFNQLSFVWLGAWSTWIIAGVVITIAVTLWLAWHNTRRLDRRRRLTLLSLRTSAIVIFFVLFLQPAARLEDVSRVKNHIAVLLDTSRSMTLPSQESSITRGAMAVAELQRVYPVLRRWEQDHHVDYFSFAGHIQSAPHHAALKKTPLQGEQTSPKHCEAEGSRQSV